MGIFGSGFPQDDAPIVTAARLDIPPLGLPQSAGQPATPQKLPPQAAQRPPNVIWTDKKPLQDLQIGDIINGQKYVGGDKKAGASWQPVAGMDTVSQLPQPDASQPNPQPATSDSALGSAARAAASGATFGVADPVVAGLQSVLGDPLNPTSHADKVIDRYHQNLAALRGVNEANEAEHPVASAAGDVAGGYFNPLVRALPKVTGLGSAFRKGAAIGTGYGLGRGVTNDNSVADTINNMGGGALGGGLTAGALHGAGAWLDGPPLNLKRAGKFLEHVTPDLISTLSRAGLFGSSAPTPSTPASYAPGPSARTPAAPTPYTPAPYVPTLYVPTS